MDPQQPVDFTLRGYRVALAYGQRNSQIWAMATGGVSLAAVGQAMGISRERARQIFDKAERKLAAWPEPNAWQATLQMRPRELCIAAGITSAEELADRLASDRTPRQWTADDTQGMRRLVAHLQRQDQVADALRRVVAGLERVRDALEVIAAANVIGAEQIRRGLLAMQQHGLAAYEAGETDEATGVHHE